MRMAWTGSETCPQFFSQKLIELVVPRARSPKLSSEG